MIRYMFCVCARVARVPFRSSFRHPDAQDDACRRLDSHADDLERLQAAHRERTRELKHRYACIRVHIPRRWNGTRLREEQEARAASLHEVTTLTGKVQQLQQSLDAAGTQLDAMAASAKQRDQALGRVQELEQLYVERIE